MDENLELLLADNEEKETKITNLMVDLQAKSTMTESLAEGVKYANEEADKLQADNKDKEIKLVQLKVEKEQKEREASEHLKQVETKAARVDQLEKQLVLLEMDKERLNRELNQMTDQMLKSKDQGNKNYVKAFERSNTLMQSMDFRSNNRKSAQVNVNALFGPGSKSGLNKGSKKVHGARGTGTVYKKAGR